MTCCPTAIGNLLGLRDRHTNGLKHLEALADAGLKAVHLLPSFHFASINEDKTTLAGHSRPERLPARWHAAAGRGRCDTEQDAFNWATTQCTSSRRKAAMREPDNRVLEYREMVKGLHRVGLRSFRMLCFNHTNAIGENPTPCSTRLSPAITTAWMPTQNHIGQLLPGQRGGAQDDGQAHS